ncbi:MAG: hypothetical protein LBL37_08895 [Gracilibacteraceae bacterium]|jgi:hypothetical protein|nr:hypothetical protein [Gracilibacteraceae bacterium]
MKKRNIPLILTLVFLTAVMFPAAAFAYETNINYYYYKFDENSQTWTTSLIEKNRFDIGNGIPSTVSYADFEGYLPYAHTKIPQYQNYNSKAVFSKDSFNVSPHYANTFNDFYAAFISKGGYEVKSKDDYYGYFGDGINICYYPKPYAVVDYYRVDGAGRTALGDPVVVYANDNDTTVFVDLALRQPSGYGSGQIVSGFPAKFDYQNINNPNKYQALDHIEVCYYQNQPGPGSGSGSEDRGASFVVKYYKDSLSGTPIHTETRSITPGSTVTAGAIELDLHRPAGYGPGTLQDSLPAVAQQDGLTVRVLYLQAGSPGPSGPSGSGTPGTPSAPGTPGTPSTPGVPSTSSTPPTHSVPDNSSPTGNPKTGAAAATGMGALIFLGLLALRLKIK